MMIAIGMRVLAATACILVASQGIFAAQMTTADLLSLCKSDENACRLYILGVSEGASLAAGMAKNSMHFCVPEGVTATEMRLIFERLAREDVKRFSGDLQIPAVSMVGAAMSRQFPCH